MPVAVHSSAREILPANDRSNSRRERNTAIGIKTESLSHHRRIPGEYLRFLDLYASRFFNRYDHRIIRTFRQRNSQRHIIALDTNRLLLPGNWRPRSAVVNHVVTLTLTVSLSTRLQSSLHSFDALMDVLHKAVHIFCRRVPGTH
jgi:hypothetical protein